MSKLAERKVSEHPGSEIVPRGRVLRVAKIYAALGGVWILGTDLFVYLRGGIMPEDALVSIAKGLLFVLVTTALIHIYIARVLRRSESEREMLKRRLTEWSRHANDVILLLDEQGRILEANERAAATYGYSAAELCRMSLDELVADDADWRKRWAEMLSAGSARASNLHCRANGEIFPIEYSAKRIETREGVLVQSIIRDMSESKRLEMDLRRLTTAIEQSPATVIITDTAGTIQYVNPAFTANSGYTAAEAMGKTVTQLRCGEMTVEERAAMRERLLGGAAWKGEFLNLRKDGSQYREEAVVAPVRDQSGQIVQFIAVKQDVTLQRQSEENARFLASHDPLTRLPNRMQGRNRMEGAIAEAQVLGRKAALMFLDVDHFKRVNDSLGHALGDCLLQALAERLRTCIGGEGVLSRLEGDEFLIVLPSVSDCEEAEKMAERIRMQTARSYPVEGFELSATVSVGIAVYPDDGESFEELQRHADLAMEFAKRAGRNTYQRYRCAMEDEAHEYMLILNGLRKAIKRHEFVLHYQPQIEIGSGRVSGVEALIRWRHPELGLISPVRFIPVAEESGLIAEIGNWVLEESCQQAAAWHTEGYDELVMAANVSAVQFRGGRLETAVEAALSSSGLDPRLLVLEITESVLAEDKANVAATLNRLRGLGVRVALDDFGTGYASFGYLSQFRLDKLKIDQSFVRNAGSSKGDEVIVRSIVNLARSFGLRTVAEGVESEPALEMARRTGCDEAQGFFFAKPMVAEEIPGFVVARRLGYSALPIGVE